MSVWERCVHSNYVIRAEPSGHLCGRAKDRLLDLTGLVCVKLDTICIVNTIFSFPPVRCFDAASAAASADEFWWRAADRRVGECDQSQPGEIFYF